MIRQKRAGGNRDCSEKIIETRKKEVESKVMQGN